MKTNRIRLATFFILVVFLLEDTISSTGHFDQPPSSHNSDYAEETTEAMKRSKTLAIAGSRLPDCSHACGACSPCKLVIVTLNNLACSSPAEAETCPVSYRCMCNNKIYPVP